jgi:histidyl-tRNA synthetase
LLDCKQPSCQPLTAAAPRSADYLCPECREHFDILRKYLTKLDLPFTVVPDGYADSIIIPYGVRNPASDSGAQNTIGGGGRYDNLIEELGGKPTPAAGFAAGIERIILNLKRDGITAPPIEKPVFL